MQAVLSTQLPKSPFHLLLCSLLLVTLDTNAQGPEGKGEGESRRMASHFLGGPINFLQRRRNSRSWWKIPVHKHDIKDVDEDLRPKGDGGSFWTSEHVLTAQTCLPLRRGDSFNIFACCMNISSAIQNARGAWMDMRKEGGTQS